MTSAPRSAGPPILGRLSIVGRVMLVATIVVSLAAIVLDFGLHADPTILIVVWAATILGLAWVVGLSTERLGALTGPQVGGILNATFTPLEVAAVAAAVGISTVIAIDGESNWLEGALLTLVYVIVAGSFFEF